MRLLLIILLSFFFCSQNIAQLNLNVIYGIGKTSPKIHDKITKQYNDDRTWLTGKYDQMKWLNGFGLGLRYKIDRIAFDVRWENQIDRLKSSGVNPSLNNTAFSQELFFKLTTYGVGVESFLRDQFSIHASFDFNKVRYRAEESNIDDKFEVMSDWGMGSTFSIGYNFIGGGLMHVSIRPFFHVSWTNHDLTELNSFLNPDSQNTDPVNFEEEFLNYGLKIIFHNGQW